jgi:CheY-like chemotaxis protein
MSLGQPFNSGDESQPGTERKMPVLTSAHARLLVVDDEESLRITTAAILEQEGYVVDTAASGDEAISLLAETDYDLVLTDLHMEGGDGITVLSQIKRNAPFTISVVLTGFASVESAISALQEGAYDYLIKPCDIEHETHDPPRRGAPPVDVGGAESTNRTGTIESRSGTEN